jgi:hypothetical protein
MPHFCFETPRGLRVHDSREPWLDCGRATTSVPHLVVYDEVQIGVPSASVTCQCITTILDAGIEESGQGLEMMSLAFRARPPATHERRSKLGCRSI